MRAHRRWQTMGCAKRSFLSVSAAVLAALASLSAQAGPADPQKIGAPAAGQPRAAGLGPVAGIVPPPEYVIGPNDSLSVLFWRDKDMSTDVMVRPDGNITLPLLNDIHAAGLTPDQLRERILVEVDAFTPGSAVQPYAANLRENISRRALKVWEIPFALLGIATPEPSKKLVLPKTSCFCRSTTVPPELVTASTLPRLLQ